jgi:hypothetical protein
VWCAAQVEAAGSRAHPRPDNALERGDAGKDSVVHLNGEAGCVDDQLLDPLQGYRRQVERAGKPI